MSYHAIVEMAKSDSLRDRLVACAAQEGEQAPEAWVGQHLWKLATTAGWADDWDYAKGTYTLDKNPDFGKRNDIISDQKILSAVQAVRTAPA